MNKKLSLKEQKDRILELAEKKGLASNYFFSTTFNRYETQLDVLTMLDDEIRNSGAVVTKEYVKGRENTYSNPAIAEFNRTSTAANGTVTTLIKILQSMGKELPDTNSSDNPLLKLLAERQGLNKTT